MVYDKDLFELCSGTYTQALELYCGEINNSDSDVFVIMAHKAVRLFQVLLDQGRIAVDVSSKIIISNHALGFNSRYLTGKKITIIDDIVISGTSIATTVNKLIRLGVPEDKIDIIALAIDKKYLTMSFAAMHGRTALKCGSRFDDATCIELSYQISKAFSYYGLPYNVDFPVFTMVVSPDEAITILNNQLLCSTTYYSNIEQERGHVTAATIIPADILLADFWNKIGVNLSQCVHLKVRVLIKRYASGKREFNFVPMCLFDGISEDDLKFLFERFRPAQFDESVCYDSITQMRYLEHFFASIFFTHLQRKIALNSCVHDPTSVRLLFGYNDCDGVIRKVNESLQNNTEPIEISRTDSINKQIIHEYLESRIGKEANDVLETVQTFSLEKVSLYINEILLSPFRWWYNSRELPVRNDIKHPRRHYIKSINEVESKTDRLNNGFNFPTLCELFSECFPEFEHEKAISLFLDRAIDEGIIVPTIHHYREKHYLCRSYRHGEDLPFGREDQCRFLYYLSELGDKIPSIVAKKESDKSNVGIADISFEKILVLFYQMGLKKGNIFNRFLGFDNIPLLKSYLSIHGTITAFINPAEMKQKNIDKDHFYSERHPTGGKYITWLTSWLESNNFIISQKEKTGGCFYLLNQRTIKDFLRQNSDNCMTSNIQGQISNIAAMNAFWYNSLIRHKKKFKQNATALTSCSDADTFSAAIATEIHYFYNFWSNQGKKALEAAASYSGIKNELKRRSEDAQYFMTITQGMNSGREKVTWFEKGSVKTISLDVSKDLKDNQYNWNEIWDSANNVSPGYLPMSLKQAKHTYQVVALLYFYSACLDSLTNPQIWAHSDFKRFNDYEKQYLKYYRKSEGLLGYNHFKKLVEIFENTDFIAKKSQLIQLIDSTLVFSEKLVDDIENDIMTGSELYSVRYIGSLIVDLRLSNADLVDSSLMKIWNEFTDFSRKTQLNIVRFPDVLCPENWVRIGVFYGISGLHKNVNPKECCELLTYFYKNICLELSDYLLESQSVLMPDTPVGRRFTHNTRNNQTSNLKKFLEETGLGVSLYDTDGYLQSMVCLSTDNIADDALESISQMKWDCHSDSEATENFFTKRTLYFNNHIIPENRSHKSTEYSTVKITRGGEYGNGILLEKNGRLICITCKHILTKYPDEPIIASSFYASQVDFNLVPLKEITLVESDKASDEVSVLCLQKDWRIYFDRSAVLSEENMVNDMQEYIGKECMCYSVEEKMGWSDVIKIKGMGANEFYQGKYDKKDTSNPKNGYSGAALVLAENHLALLGMHESHREGNSDTLIIPTSIINREINKLLN